MTKYKRISTGKNQYRLYKSENLDVYAQIDVYKKQDYYIGIYDYEERHFQHYKVAGSLAGITDVKTRTLIFDFDENPKKNIDFEDARNSTINTVDRLLEYKIPIAAIQIYFSGNKGFHIHIDTCHEFTREQFTDIVYSLAYEEPGFDTRIVDQQRLIRIPLTYNAGTEKRKIPITFDELRSLDIDSLYKKANFSLTEINPELIALFDSYNRNAALPEAILQLKWRKKEKENSPNGEAEVGGHLNLENKPNWIDGPRYALQEGFFVEGQRNTAFMILAAFYRNQGFDADQALALLKITAEKQSKRYDVEQFSDWDLENNIIGFVFSDRWNGGVYSKEHELLKEKEIQFNLTPQKDGGTQLVTISDIFNTLLEEATNLESYRITTGIAPIDEKVVLVKGMAFGLLGSPGSGKTSVINQITKHMTLSGKTVLYESLDMQRSMQALKFLNQAIDEEGNPYFSHPKNMVQLHQFIKENPERFKEITQKAQRGFENIYFNYMVSCVEDIIKRLQAFTNQHGKGPDIVVIDYLEKIRGPANDPLRDINHIIPRITDAAKEFKTCIAVLLQPQKSSDGRNLEIDRPLTMRNIKGSSIIEQDLRVIFSIWRPGALAGDDRFMEMAVVKNNMGPQSKFQFSWDGPRGIIKPLDRAGELALEALRERIENEEAEEQNTNRGFSRPSGNFDL